MANIPSEVFEADVSHGARLLAAYLWTLAHDDADWVGPRVNDLSLALSQARSSTRKQLTELEDQGMIRRDTQTVFGRETAGWSLARKTLHQWSVCSAPGIGDDEARAANGAIKGAADG